MNAKLKMTKEEFVTLNGMVRFAASIIVTDMESTQRRDALEGLALRMMGAYRRLKGTTTLTLSDMETLALHTALKDDFFDSFPYERALAIRLLDDMERQRLAAESLRMGNLSAAAALKMGAPEPSKLLNP